MKDQQRSSELLQTVQTRLRIPDKLFSPETFCETDALVHRGAHSGCERAVSFPALESFSTMHPFTEDTQTDGGWSGRAARQTLLQSLSNLQPRTGTSFLHSCNVTNTSVLVMTAQPSVHAEPFAAFFTVSIPKADQKKETLWFPQQSGRVCLNTLSNQPSVLQLCFFCHEAVMNVPFSDVSFLFL